MDPADPARHGLPEAESIRSDSPEQSRTHPEGALSPARPDGGGGPRGAYRQGRFGDLSADGSRGGRRLHPARISPIRNSPPERRRALVSDLGRTLYGLIRPRLLRGAVVMRAHRAASLALIAVVLIHTSILATGLSNTSGRLASATPAPSLPAMIVNTGTTVASSRATETISRSQRAADPRAVNVSP